MHKTRSLKFATYLLLLIVAAVTVTLPLSAQEQQEQIEQPPPPKTLEELQQAIQAILNQTQVPGAGIALVNRNQTIWVGGVGQADIASGITVTTDTQFRVGSVSKSIVALAIMKLVEQGKIKLDDKVTDLAPEIAIQNPWAETHPVLVAHLLEHTAGFDDMRFNAAYNTEDIAEIPLQQVFQKFPGPQQVRWQPGERMAYSNPGYGLVGYLIEKVTGQPFEDYVQKAVLAPLGMHASSFRLTDAVNGKLSLGYTGQPPLPVPYKHIYLRPAGDLKSSPEELALLVRMWLNRGQTSNGRFLSPNSIARMEVPETNLAARSGLKLGYGLANYASLDQPIVGHGHDGGIDGFFSRYRYLPYQGFGYVVLLNSTGPDAGRAMRQISNLLFGYLTQNLAPPVPPSVEVSEADLLPYVGTYESANPRNQIMTFLDILLNSRQVYLEDGALYQKALFQSPQKLIPVGNNQFRLESQPAASFVFASDNTGTVVQTGRVYRVQNNDWWPLARLPLLLACLGLMVTSLLFGLVWVPRKLSGRLYADHLVVRTVPLLTVVSFGAAALLVTLSDISALGSANLISQSLWFLLWAFAVLSPLSLLLALWSFVKDVSTSVRIHSLLVSLGCCGLAAYLAYYGIIGLRTWVW